MHKRETMKQASETHAQINYVVIPSEITVEGVKATTYGIGAVLNGTVVDSVPDVSVEREKVEAVVALCNAEKLELCHLNAVAEDATI